MEQISTDTTFSIGEKELRDVIGLDHHWYVAHAAVKRQGDEERVIEVRFSKNVVAEKVIGVGRSNKVEFTD